MINIKSYTRHTTGHIFAGHLTTHTHTHSGSSSLWPQTITFSARALHSFSRTYDFSHTIFTLRASRPEPQSTHTHRHTAKRNKGKSIYSYAVCLLIFGATAYQRATISMRHETFSGHSEQATPPLCTFPLFPYLHPQLTVDSGFLSYLTLLWLTSLRRGEGEGASNFQQFV